MGEPHSVDAVSVADAASLNQIPAQEQAWPGTDAELSPRPEHGARGWTARDRLTGKKALVTGGDSGIGRAIAVTYAAEGASVVIAHLEEEQADADETCRLITEAGGSAVAIAADLREHQACVDLAARAVEELGGLDILVCNAGYQMAQDSLEGFSPDQLQRTFATNFFSTFWLAQELTPHLTGGGAMLVTTSIQAYQPSDHLLDYAATKAALNNFVVNLAAELGPRGVRVNAVAPGPIWTPLIPSTFTGDKVEGFGSDTPLGRAGHPVEVAAAFVFLGSDEASYISGTVLGVTGGKPVF